jgi:small conductance mechanosensitive channel
MVGADDPNLAETFLIRYDDELSAAVTLVVTIGLVVTVNRLLGRLFDRPRVRDVLDLHDPRVDTRLRIVRRLVVATIAIIGITAALSQFSALDRLATSLLASGAIVAAVVGFAAQRSLGNVVAGILLAVAQPVRIGDLVTFEGETGTVEDMGLTYTVLRTGADARLVVPNERVAGGVLRNDTIITRSVVPEVSVWLPASADVDRALELLAEEAGPGSAVQVVEMTAEGRVRLTVSGTTHPAEERFAREAELRAACLRRLRSAGLLADGQESAPQGRSYTR